MSKTMTSVPRRRGPKGFWIALRRVWRKKHETTIGQIVTTALVLAVAGWFIIAAINRVSNRQRTSDTRAALERDYEIAHTLYDRQVQEHDACVAGAVTRVESRDVVRDQLIAIAANGADRSIAQAEGLRSAVLAILPNSAGAKTAMDTYVQSATDTATRSIELAHRSQNIEYPSLDLTDEQAKCVPPGPEPVDPTP